MQRFRDRIKYYLVGFAFGLVIMYMIFGNRGCSWLPENRIKNMIAEKEILIGDSLQEVMNCAKVTNTDIYRLLNEDGDVDLSQSATNVYPKKYYFTGTKEEKELVIIYALYDSIAEVVDFKFKDNSCTSALSNTNKTAVPLPDKDVRKIIESHDIRIMTKADCELKCLNLSEEEVLNFHKTASFSVAQSKPREFPNAVYVMQGTIRNTTYSIKYVIGENRTRISTIEPNDCGCE